MISIRRRGLQAYYLGALLALTLYGIWSTRSRPCYTCFFGSPPQPQTEPSTAPIPELAHIPSFTNTGPNAEFCRRRFTSAYLEEIRDHSIQYCEQGDNKTPLPSRLTCFHAHVRDDGGVDSMCIGSGATWNAADKKFELQCPTIRRLNKNETDQGLIAFDAIKASWFDTGPRRVFDKFISLSGQAVLRGPARTPASHTPTRHVILVKREGNNNLWHSLMEIQSMMSTIDALRMSRQDGDHQPFFRYPEDAQNTHIVMLDDYPEESTFDLWRFFSHNPIIKLGADETSPLGSGAPFRDEDGPFNIIVPISGGSNPTWQNDWVDRTDCTEAPLIKLLVKRVFEHYGVVREDAPLSLQNFKEHAMTITFINRRGSRQLIGNEALLAKLEEKYPRAVIQSIDFATLSLADQLRTIQATDILVGVHGAGLTHTMFMREHYGAVVEIQPEGMGHKGFANMAAMTGHAYFMAEGQIVLPEEVDQFRAADGEKEDAAKGRQASRRDAKPRPWQSSHVHIQVKPFLDVMGRAVEALVEKAAQAG